MYPVGGAIVHHLPSWTSASRASSRYKAMMVRVYCGLVAVLSLTANVLGFLSKLSKGSFRDARAIREPLQRPGVRYKGRMCFCTLCER